MKRRGRHPDTGLLARGVGRSCRLQLAGHHAELWSPGLPYAVLVQRWGRRRTGPGTTRLEVLAPELGQRPADGTGAGSGSRLPPCQCGTVASLTVAVPLFSRRPLC